MAKVAPRERTSSLGARLRALTGAGAAAAPAAARAAAAAARRNPAPRRSSRGRARQATLAATAAERRRRRRCRQRLLLDLAFASGTERREKEMKSAFGTSPAQPKSFAHSPRALRRRRAAGVRAIVRACERAMLARGAVSARPRRTGPPSAAEVRSLLRRRTERRQMRIKDLPTSPRFSSHGVMGLPPLSRDRRRPCARGGRPWWRWPRWAARRRRPPWRPRARGRAWACGRRP